MTVQQPNATDTDAGLADAIRLLGRTNVLVVGDVMLDRGCWCRAAASPR